MAREHSGGETAGNVELLASARGIWALRWSLGGLAATAVLQLIVTLISGSVALLADTIHNFADALTALPLWVAFAFSTRPPNRRFTYGYHRLEDLAGLFIMLILLLSAGVTALEAYHRLLHPRVPSHLAWVALAGVIGFLGNEAVAVFRIRVGRELGSAALVADGHHARVDGLTSLAVVLGAVGVHLGFPLADPLIGFAITVAILGIVWEAGRDVFAHLLDSIEPETIERIEQLAIETPGVREVHGVRARWLGHVIRAELDIVVGPDITVARGHDIALNLRERMFQAIPRLGDVTVHIDPVPDSEEGYHDESTVAVRRPG